MCVDRLHLPILELLHTFQTVININFISMGSMALSWTAQGTQDCTMSCKLGTSYKIV